MDHAERIINNNAQYPSLYQYRYINHYHLKAHKSLAGQEVGRGREAEEAWRGWALRDSLTTMASDADYATMYIQNGMIRIGPCFINSIGVCPFSPRKWNLQRLYHYHDTK